MAKYKLGNEVQAGDIARLIDDEGVERVGVVQDINGERATLLVVVYPDMNIIGHYGLTEDMDFVYRTPPKSEAAPVKRIVTLGVAAENEYAADAALKSKTG